MPDTHQIPLLPEGAVKVKPKVCPVCGGPLRAPAGCKACGFDPKTQTELF